ncbi:hypothetical protein BT93_B0090 [Corymbia citriodora subsp. variegata]|nr:hypothetical protein BT93_B0090 [Corymbia citriodora subsp. variegata]
MNLMNIDFHETKMTRTTLLFSFFIFFHALLYSISINTGWLALCASVLPVAGVLLTAALLVIAARATLMTWIAIIVLLAFSGKRRRFLALQGRKITTDIAVNVVKVAFRGKGLAALVCATFLSFLLIITR